MPELLHLDEPSLLFKYDQALADPRDGLTLFGPLDSGKPYGIRWGVIGLPASIETMLLWVKRIQRPVLNPRNDLARPPFPGFKEVFGISWSTEPVHRIDLSKNKLQRIAYLDDPYKRVYQTVELYSQPIIENIRQEDIRPDIWFVLIPEFVYTNCRPLSYLTPEERIPTNPEIQPADARMIELQPFLFKEAKELAKPYAYELNFHHQLKARLLSHDAPTQIIRDWKIQWVEEDDNEKQDGRIAGLESAIAWNIATATFYKAGGRPWKLGAGRDGVCYMGLVFKRDEKYHNPRVACCAAQMFLDSGDGVVFKGAVGPWYHGKRGHFHLSRQAASEVAHMCVKAYKDRTDGQAPSELFIHGRVRFDDAEWEGFVDGAGASTKLVGVRIEENRNLKVFRQGKYAILRGQFHAFSDRIGYLWTRGFVPRLRSYPGREVPNALEIEICRGDASLETVAKDILALTKLNYNSCIFADGFPVTLKFANAVGEILTAGPQETSIPPLPFKHYI